MPKRTISVTLTVAMTKRETAGKVKTSFEPLFQRFGSL